MFAFLIGTANGIADLPMPLVTCIPDSGDIVILQLGDDLLRQCCDEIETEKIKNVHSYPALLSVRDRLHKALQMHKGIHGYGRACAAPQIGEKLMMIAMKLSDREPAVTLYNPHIIEHSEEKMSLWDDCFSIEGKMIRLERYKTVTVKFVNDQGDDKIWRCEEALSELLQHEIDHLNGILAIDRVLPDLTDCKSIIDRTEWLRDQDFYNKHVTYIPSNETF